MEQKNWSVVRRLIGYDRYETEAELALLQRLYQWLRRWTNHWQPVLKLIGKEREGGKVRKRYDTAQTPYRRMLASGVLKPAARARLDQEHAAYGPAAVWREVDAARAALWRLPGRRTPGRELAGAAAACRPGKATYAATIHASVRFSFAATRRPAPPAAVASPRCPSR